MTAKEYLNRVRRQYYVVKRAEEELTAIKADILSLKASSMTEHVSGTKESDLADKYIRLERYFDTVTAEWDKLIDMRIEAKAMIRTLPDETQQAVLYARYINCGRWEDIAAGMNYSWKHIFRLHGKALQSFAAIHQSALDN
ncbi:DUF1492 domain-containing protein [uncultured Megasphaera sp.]|jgi:SMC interacting uncharacterized protein involved in chromosome segregation|uniref:DUF1492 domain-containing protein n=1 Tax=uncultured Megasphaera sp. TaxID=165188 RepID=UPI002065A424|nr:DUF1492 domain-containing protein [uncultured Megasphaera sp.]DAE81210.1 MAG TPA: Protein of unknown function (DUF1492) [Caudoviricetes sp.]